MRFSRAAGAGICCEVGRGGKGGLSEPKGVGKGGNV